MRGGVHKRDANQKTRKKLTAQGTTRCAFCSWEQHGSMLSGILAARAHRRDRHPNLPERSPSSRPRAKATDSVYSKQEKRVLDALRSSPEPITVGEVATAADIPSHRVGAILRKTPEASQLYNSRWTLTDF